MECYTCTHCTGARQTWRHPWHMGACMGGSPPNRQPSSQRDRLPARLLLGEQYSKRHWKLTPDSCSTCYIVNKLLFGRGPSAMLT